MPEGGRGSGCVSSVLSIGIKLFLLLVLVAFVYFGYVAYFGGVGPDWIVKGYTNKHYREAESHARAEEYELAIHEFELAISEEPDHAAMVLDCKMNMAACYEKIAEDLEPLVYGDTPEAREAAAKQSKAYRNAMDIYNEILKENPKNRAAQTRRDVLLFKTG
jgi:tetratricopeptide (TPR) repeat protein